MKTILFMYETDTYFLLSAGIHINIKHEVCQLTNYSEEVRNGRYLTIYPVVDLLI